MTDTEKITIVIDRVEVGAEGESQYGKWMRYDIFDGNGERHPTFKEKVAQAAELLKGKKVDLEEEKTERGNRVISVWEHKEDEAPAQAKLGTGEYVHGQKPPIEARRIFASTSWNCATSMIESYARIAPMKQEITPDFLFDLCKGWADKIHLDLLRKGKALEDEDIPF